VIKISLIAKENLTKITKYFDVYSQNNQLKIAILGVRRYIAQLSKQLIKQKIQATTNYIVVR